MSASHQFTPQQLKNFAAYVGVQRRGKFNMLDPRAIRQTSMTGPEWFFCIENYDALHAAIKELDASAPATKPVALTSEQAAAMDDTAGLEPKQTPVDPFYNQHGHTPLLSGYKATRTTKD